MPSLSCSQTEPDQVEPPGPESWGEGSICSVNSREGRTRSFSCSLPHLQVQKYPPPNRCSRGICRYEGPRPSQRPLGGVLGEQKAA